MRTATVPRFLDAFASNLFVSSASINQPCGFHIPVLPSLLSHHVENYVWPIIKHTSPGITYENPHNSGLTALTNMLYGGPGRYRPGVRNAFALKELQQFFINQLFIT